MFDVTIIGCGIIGASVAYRLSKYNLRVLVLESENDVAMGTTKANSAIIHAGYDPKPGTLMARLNVEGNAQMEQLCRSLSVEYQQIGSLVLAFGPEDLGTIKKLYHNGLKNGVSGMKLLSGSEARAMEPALSEEVCGALYAPSTGIVDPWGLCIAQAETALRNGVKLRLNSPVTGIEDRGGYCQVYTPAGSISTSYVINCAGTHGHEISAMVGGQEWEDLPSRGEYYLLDKSSGNLVQHVIFQCPTECGKGVLVAPTVHGNLLVGPNAEQIRDPDDCATTAVGLESVAKAGRKSIPTLDMRQSIRNFAGVRAVTSEEDFILRPSSHLPRLLHAAGIKSPGLSCAPAIADYVVNMLADRGLPLIPKKDWNGTRTQIRFRNLTQEKKAALIAMNPEYGRIICRCETITEGEILEAIHSPIPPHSIDGLKRRVGAGMGRCQGGFCGPKVLEILARELQMNPLQILQDGCGTWLLLERSKGETENEI